jgi:hypothetical protein
LIGQSKALGFTFPNADKKKVNYFLYPLYYRKFPYICLMAHKNEQSEILNFKASKHLKLAIKAAADEKGLKPGTFIKAVVKKHIKYKEPELV